MPFLIFSPGLDELIRVPVIEVPPSSLEGFVMNQIVTLWLVLAVLRLVDRWRMARGSPVS